MAAYVVLRQMRRMENHGAADQALALGRTEMSNNPSLPLAIGIATRLVQRGEMAQVLATLDFATRLKYEASDEWGLAQAVARLVEQAGSPEKALQVYRNLFANNELPSAFRDGFSPEALRLAKARGDAEFAASLEKAMAPAGGKSGNREIGKP
jgi:thioesterase domain-containing protein